MFLLVIYVRIKRFLTLGSITVADVLQLAVGWNSPTSGSQPDVRENPSGAAAAATSAAEAVAATTTATSAPLDSPSALLSPTGGDFTEDQMPKVGRIEFKADDGVATIHRLAAGDREQTDELELFHSPLAASSLSSKTKPRCASEIPPPSP